MILFLKKVKFIRKVLLHALPVIFGGFCGLMAQENRGIAPVGGVLFPPSVTLENNSLKPKGCTADLTDGTATEIITKFLADKKNRFLRFPCPVPGWDLSNFAGIEVELVNLSEESVTASLRAHNAEELKDEAYNIERAVIAPHETKKIQLLFGTNYGVVGYPLESSHVSSIDVFLEKPKQSATLLIRNLKAYGTSSERGNIHALSTPADRMLPVKIPDWLGKRPPIEGNWVKTLDEDFNDASLKTSLWTTRLTWDGPDKTQLQRYSKENVLVENGILKIKCENKLGPQYDNPALEPRQYTTGVLSSFGKWTQLYGYIEARVKLPTASGLWPIFAMMPDRGGAEDSESIKRREDTSNGGMRIHILESQTELGVGRYQVATHWDGFKTDHKKWTNAHVYYGRTPEEWHVWGILWEPGKIVWYCDGIKKEEWKNERVASVPEYISFVVQMGSWAAKRVDEGKLPDYLQIDYVRAWQLQSRIK